MVVMSFYNSYFYEWARLDTFRSAIIGTRRPMRLEVLVSIALLPVAVT